jgi:hypothetical protein
MTVSSDAFVFLPCFKHQLKTWHEHGRTAPVNTVGEWAL